MSAGDHLSPGQFPAGLREVITSFRDRTHGDYSDPINAANSCADASEQFQGHARMMGVNNVGRMTVEYPHAPPPRDPNTHTPGTPGLSYGHTVNVSHGHVIDWTARQFDSSAKFPHVEPVKSFRAKWKNAVKD